MGCYFGRNDYTFLLI